MYVTATYFVTVMFYRLSNQYCISIKNQDSVCFACGYNCLSLLNVNVFSSIFILLRDQLRLTAGVRVVNVKQDTWCHSGLCWQVRICVQVNDAGFSLCYRS